MLRAQNINGEVAAKIIPNAKNGLNNNQQNAVIITANDNDNNKFP